MSGALPGTSLEEDEGLLSDINVTPLVDVVLVLLFIFMATAPLLMSTLKVEVPEVAAGAPAASRTIVIVLDAEGSIAVEGRIVTLEDAVELAAARVKAGTGDVYLRADRGVPYGTVASVLDALMREGVTGVGLVVQRLPETLPGEPSGSGQGRRR